MDIYDQIFKLASPIITAYRNDLEVHDKDFIEEHPGLPFLHFTRDTGTWIIAFHKANDYPPPGVSVRYLFGHAKRERILRNGTIYLLDAIKRGGLTKLILYCNGKTVQEIDFEKACELTREYHDSIFNQWRAQEYTLKAEKNCEAYK